jgi:Protein of unknown function (DUF3551)
MRNPHMAWFVAAVVITIAGGAQPSAAAVIYPWCANYSGRGMGGAQNCGFVTFNQCLATVRGVGGTCGPNPLYQPYPPSPRYGRPIRRAY